MASKPITHTNYDNSMKRSKYDSKVTRKIYDLLNQGKISMALKWTQDYIKEYPTDGVGLLLYAKCMIGLDEEEAKITCFKLIEDEIKSDLRVKGEALFLLGNMEKNSGNSLEAKEYYRRSAALGFLMAKHELIKDLILNSDYEKALDMINNMNTLDYDIHTYLLKASALYHLERFDEGLDIMNQIDTTSLTKGILIYYYTEIKANFYIATGRNEEAEQVLEAYIKKSSRYNKNYCLLVDCYLKRKKVKEAYLLCKDIMENADDSIKLYTRFSLGNAYRELGNFDKAKEEYLKATDSSNSKSRISASYISLGELSLIEGDYEQARRYFQKLDSTDRKCKVRKTIFLAIVELKLHNISKAYKMLSKIDVHSIPMDLHNLYHQTKTIAMHEMGKQVDGEDYFTQQLVHYSKSSAIKHVNNYHKKGNSCTFFEKSIPAYSLLNLAPTLLESGVMIENRAIEKYLVPYQNVGYCNGKLTNYMEVVMLSGTDHVLTMYPVNYLSEEELQKEEKQAFQKKKIPSQIAKFNERYGQKG